MLLSASLLPEGGPLIGHVHAFLHQEAPEWAVLWPSWFMQDFTEGYHFFTIRDEGLIYSATGDGAVAFIDAEDIAASAAPLLTTLTTLNRDFVLTGPRAISYDEAARMISRRRGGPCSIVVSARTNWRRVGSRPFCRSSTREDSLPWMS